jgi:hypothetical protein
LLGFNLNDYIGIPYEEIFPTHKTTEMPAIYKDIARNGGKWHENRYIYTDDKISGMYDITAFQASPGYLLSMFFDVTEQIKKIEEDLKTHNNLS